MNRSPAASAPGWSSTMPTSTTSAPIAANFSPTNLPYPANRSHNPANCGQYAARPMLNSPTLQVDFMPRSLPRALPGPHHAGPELDPIVARIVVAAADLTVGEVEVAHAADQEGAVLDLDA